MLYLISYDLSLPGQRYQAVHDTIRTFGDWCHPMQSVWLVDTPYSALEMTNFLMAVTDSNDRMLVTRVGPDFDGWLPSSAHRWVNERLYGGTLKSQGVLFGLTNLRTLP